jgi:hypothetical protein
MSGAGLPCRSGAVWSMRRSEVKHLLVAVASLEPLAKRQTLLKLLDGKSVIVGDPRADKFQSLLECTENLIRRFPQFGKSPAAQRDIPVFGRRRPETGFDLHCVADVAVKLT